LLSDLLPLQFQSGNITPEVRNGKTILDTPLQTIYENVLTGQKNEAADSVVKALEAGIDANEILKNGLIRAMEEVGARFESGDFFVPEMLIAARAMKASLLVLRPQLVDEGVEPAGKIVIGTVNGDLHDIGKNLVAMMLEGAGFEIIDLGADVPAQLFVAAIQEHRPHLVCLSALLTTTMSQMKITIQALEQAGLRDWVKVMVGGAPVTERFAHDIGADGYAPDASKAVSLAKELVRNEDVTLPGPT
jgi:5-methyltetrahydrofolate--homocysteine methyltransferase